MDLEKLRDLVKTQCSDGNWNYDPYMHGMANGLICALAVLEGKEPKYMDAPSGWLRGLVDPNAKDMPLLHIVPTGSQPFENCDICGKPIKDEGHACAKPAEKK
jgi:hypothetical protein